jgi:hypothetical protein
MPYLWCLAAAFAFIASCVVSGDDRCGERQVEQKGEYQGCICEPGFVFSTDGKRCVQCGDHEVVRDSVCVCDDGYARPSNGKPCEAVVDAGPQDAASAPGETGEGTACTTSADCEGLYATYCVTLLPPSTCIIQGCATGERTCPGSSVCCDFADFAALASTNGICTPPAMCIAPGKRVDP